MKRFFKQHNLPERRQRGQSFVELALVLSILLLLFAGMAEFGALLNQYINVTDAAREGARAASNYDPFVRTTSPFGLDANFFNSIANNVVIPSLGGVTLNPASRPIKPGSGTYAGDDIVISIVSVHGKAIVRFPSADGWSRYGTQKSKLTNTALIARLSGTAPDTGLVVVEIFYGYPQILKLPFFTSVIPDPIAVHAYAIMPLSAAEPTPTPKP